MLARWQADAVANALRAAGCTVYVTKQDGSAWNSGAQDHGHRSTPSLNWAQQLLAAVGKERADAAYKAMSRVLHPDVGGSHELMQQLNAARDELMSRGPR